MSYLFPETNERGDIRCPNDREYLNLTCYKCGMSRSAAERYYARTMDLVAHALEERTAQLVEAKSLNRQLQEEAARSYYLEGTRMYEISHAFKNYVVKAEREGCTPAEAMGRALGQTLADMGYSSPGSEAGL